MFEFILPDLGEGIHEGEILKWYVEVGETIAEDDPLVEVETDKAAVTIPSPVAGVIARQGGKVGDIINVGEVVVVIDTGDGVAVEAPSAPVDSAVDLPVEKASAPAVAVPATVTATAAAPGRPVPAAPATRRLARELGVDLRLVPATGPGGRVTPEDVQGFAAGGGTTPSSPSTPAVTERQAEAAFAAHGASAIPFLDLEPMPDFAQYGEVEIEALRSIRRKVAHKMTTTKLLVPHVWHMDEADVTKLEAFRHQAREGRDGQPGGKLTLLAFVIKAVTAGLRAAPAFNASLDPFKEEIIYKRYYNIGIAADTGRGLIVPVIRETDRKSIIQIATDITAVVGRAREGKVEPDDLRGGTFTITNVGPLGGTALIPAINYPEVAILGMGKVQEKPVVRDGEIVVRKMLPLTLGFDHRVADGADAARFVSELVRQLSDPNLLLLET